MMIDLKFILRRLKYLIIRLRFYFRDSVSIGKYVYLGRRVNLASNISIGDCSYIGQYSYIAPNTIIGNFCLMSDYVNIIGHDHVFNFPGVPVICSGVPESTPETVIGDDVWIGHASTIMRGIDIGNGAIIASNSVVTKSVPAYEVWGGIPARKIRDRFENEQIIIHERFLKDFSCGKVILRHDRKINSGDFL